MEAIRIRPRRILAERRIQEDVAEHDEEEEKNHVEIADY